MAHFLLLALAAVVAMATCEHGGAAPPPLSAAAGEYLRPHNQARAEVGVGPLRWSKVLANATSRLVRYQRNKMGCKFAELRSGGDNYKYGANQLWGSGLVVPPRMAVENWVKEKEYYNAGNNTCIAGHQCGVYKQVVWRKTVEVGCAQATCSKDHSTLTICFYNPAGNIVGQRPY